MNASFTPARHLVSSSLSFRLETTMHGFATFLSSSKLLFSAPHVNTEQWNVFIAMFHKTFSIELHPSTLDVDTVYDVTKQHGLDPCLYMELKPADI